MVLNRKRAVAIAKDALQQLNSGVYTAIRGTYMEVGLKNTDLLTEGTRKYIDLKKVLANNIDTCNVCAVGSLLVSKVRKFNEIKILRQDAENNGVDAFSIQGELVKIFNSLNESFNTLDILLMEAVFEGTNIPSMVYTTVNHTICNENATLFNAAVLFYHCFESAETRLRGILRNIIRNNGRFIIPRKYVRLASIGL